MKITRRSFLRWSGISALGTIVFSGCGIPEEELHVESAAQIPEDLVSGLEAWYATSCGQCGSGEGIIVRVVGGRALKIEGNPDHPVSQGKSSARCQAGVQALYHPDRLTGPMRRVGDRGSQSFEPVSWQDAMDELTSSLRSQDARAVVLATEPLRGTLGMVAHKFMEAYGGLHMGYEPMEQTNLRTAMKQVFGQEHLPQFDIANADYVLSFGADFLGTWLSPVAYSRAYGEFRQGGAHRGTLVQVEPRMSTTAASADRWVYVNPGWEGVLALSIAYVLMTQHTERIDAAAAKAMTGGVGASYLANFAPTKIAASTGVPAEHIERVAGELAAHDRPLVIGGGTASAHTKGLASLSAIYSLNLLLGNTGRKGGVIFNPPSPVAGIPATATVGSFQEWQDLTQRMANGSVKLLMVHGANPAYGLPSSIGFADAMQHVDKVVSFSSFMDETTAYADLILPDHAHLEAWGDDVPEPGPGYQVVSLQQPMVRPLYQSPGSRAFGDVLLETAKALGGPVAQALPWADTKEAVRATAQKLHALGRGSVQSPDFETFWNAALQRGGWWDPNAKTDAKSPAPSKLPQRPENLAPQFDGSTGADAFQLVPFSSIGLGDGQGANLPWLQSTPDPVTTTAWQTWAEINVSTARAMGIEQGDVLEIKSAAGTIQALAYPHPAAAPGVISIPTGQGHTVYGEMEVGPSHFRGSVAKGRGSNVFSVLAPAKDQETGALAWAATRVEVRKTGTRSRVPKVEGVVTPMASEEIMPLARPEAEP